MLRLFMLRNISLAFFWFELIEIDNHKTVNAMTKIFVDIKTTKPGAARQTHFGILFIEGRNFYPQKIKLCAHIDKCRCRIFSILRVST